MSGPLTPTWPRAIRQAVDGNVAPQEAVKAYHDILKKQKITPTRALADDSEITEAALKLG